MITLKINNDLYNTFKDIISFNDILNIELFIAEKNISNKIQSDAKFKHRYKSKTGKLQQATISNVLNNEIKTYIDSSIAPYGKYITKGNRSWKPDTFIINAINNNKEYIDEEINNAIQRALNKL